MTTEPEDGAMQLGREALLILDLMVRARPDNHFQPMSDAVRKLIEVRNALIARKRANGAGTASAATLQSLNAVISVAIGAQYPIVGIKRDRIEQSRNALAEWLQQHGGGDA